MERVGLCGESEVSPEHFFQAVVEAGSVQKLQVRLAGFGRPKASVAVESRVSPLAEFLLVLG